MLRDGWVVLLEDAGLVSDLGQDQVDKVMDENIVSGCWHAENQVS